MYPHPVMKDPSLAEFDPDRRRDAPSTKTRLHFWEIDPSFRCPVVGICLKPGEHRQLLRKAGIGAAHQNAFDRHELLVASAEKRTRLSQWIDKRLARRYEKQAAEMLAMGPAVFRETFAAALHGGDVAAAIWSAAVRPAMTGDLKRDIFGHIHLYMHAGADRQATLQRKLNCGSKELAALCCRVKEVAAELRDANRRNRQLDQERTLLQIKLAKAEEENRRLSARIASRADHPRRQSLHRDNHLLREQAGVLGKRLDAAHKQNHSAEAENLQLSRDLAQQERLNRQLTSEMREALTDLTALKACDAGCPAFDLCNKRVLIVGGITRMASLYRRMIEGSGGIFDYHDGYMKKGRRSLEGRLKRGDVVLRPVGCNSHAACSVVKNLARKHKKKVFMMTNTSLNAVSQVIRQADAPGTLN